MRLLKTEKYNNFLIELFKYEVDSYRIRVSKEKTVVLEQDVSLPSKDAIIKRVKEKIDEGKFEEVEETETCEDFATEELTESI